MRGSGIPIWFFIGVLLVIYGAMILGYGVYEWQTASYPTGVQLTNLHTPVWWGDTDGPWIVLRSKVSPRSRRQIGIA